MKILFLQTGGTIDKDYPKGLDHHGYSFIITAPAYDRILKRISPGFDYETKTVIQKDSLDISDDDRELIFQACSNSPIDKIIITHGTDTMAQTAKLLSQLKHKTIVLTGALTPELFKNSDADFNLGTAVGAVTTLKSGVYIALYGRIIRWQDAILNNTNGHITAKIEN